MLWSYAASPVRPAVSNQRTIATSLKQGLCAICGVSPCPTDCLQLTSGQSKSNIDEALCGILQSVSEGRGSLEPSPNQRRKIDSEGFFRLMCVQKRFGL